MSVKRLKYWQLMIDQWITGLGRMIAWLTLVMVLMMSIIVLLRHGFDIGWIAMQESVVYMHAVVFMLGAAYTLNQDEHVRVDIFYQKFEAKTRAWINLIGTLLVLFPICFAIFLYSFDYVISAWRIYEGSGEAGGIPAVFVLKTLLLLMPVVLGIQGISTALAQIVIIIQAIDDKDA